jgi:hypothetical protein
VSEIFDRVCFGAVFDQPNEEKKIQCREKENVAALYAALGKLAKIVIVLQSARLEANEEEKRQADYRAIRMSVFSWT